MVELEYYKLEFYVDNFCLPTQELEHLRLESIFPHCFANTTTNKIVKNLRLNVKKFSQVL